MTGTGGQLYARIMARLFEHVLFILRKNIMNLRYHIIFLKEHGDVDIQLKQ